MVDGNEDEVVVGSDGMVELFVSDGVGWARLLWDVKE